MSSFIITSYVKVFTIFQALCGRVIASSDNTTVGCSSGYILSSNLPSCQPCPQDTYQPLDQPTSTTVCSNCTSGHGTVNVASNSSTDCKLFCQPGNGRSNSGSCEECKQGFWNNGNSSMRFEPCQKCPVNYSTEGSGAMDVNNCTLRICGPGQYLTGSNQCGVCEKGEYSSSQASRSCTQCPHLETTNHSGSTSKSDCNGLCYFGESECKNKGVCEVNKITGKYECRCRDLYTGPYCDQFSEFYGNFIGYLCGGFGAALIIVILIAVYIKCYRPRQLKKKRKIELQENNYVVPQQPHDYIDLRIQNQTHPFTPVTDAVNANSLSRRNPTYSQYDILDRPEEYEEIYDEIPADQSTPDYTIYKPYDTPQTSNVYTITGQANLATSQAQLNEDISPSYPQLKHDISPSHPQMKDDISPSNPKLRLDISPSRPQLKDNFSPRQSSMENDFSPEPPPIRHNFTPRGSTSATDYLQVL